MRTFYTNLIFVVATDLCCAITFACYSKMDPGRLPEITMVSGDKVLPAPTRRLFYLFPFSFLFEPFHVIARESFRILSDFVLFFALKN